MGADVNMSDTVQWSRVIDGTAQGPVIYLEFGNRQVTVQALWSDEEGVVVSVDTREDCVLTRDGFDRIQEAATHLLKLDPPHVYEEDKHK